LDRPKVGGRKQEKKGFFSNGEVFSLDILSHRRGVGPYGQEAGKGKKKEDPNKPDNRACPVKFCYADPIQGISPGSK